MTSIKMFLSYNNNEKVVQIPVIPNTLPEILQSISNEEFKTHEKTLTLLGNKSPRTFTLDLFLPTRDYDFCKGTGEEVIAFLKYVTDNRIPARLVITDSLSEILNIAISVKSFNYYYDRAKNIRAAAECTEYEFVIETGMPNISDSITFSETSVNYNGNSADVKSANADGYNLVRARDVLELMNKDVGWNAERKQIIADGETLDIYTEVHDGNAYCYIRDIAVILGLEINFNPNDKSIILGDGV